MEKWTDSNTNFRHRRYRTESVEGVFSLSPPIEKLDFCCHVVTEEENDADREELIRVTTIALCCHTIVTRRHACNKYIIKRLCSKCDNVTM